MTVMSLIKKEEGQVVAIRGDFKQEDRSLDNDPGRNFGAHSTVLQDGNQGKKKVQLTAADVITMKKEASLRESWDVEVQRDETEPFSEDALMSSFEEDARGDEPTSPEARQLRELAVIPKVESLSCKSKRRAQSGDEHSLDRAMRIKAARNLDLSKEKDNSSTTHASLFIFQMSK
jgi:hypothetical protein